MPVPTFPPKRPSWSTNLLHAQTAHVQWFQWLILMGKQKMNQLILALGNRHTVDSWNPANHLGCFWNPVNKRISTTNLNTSTGEFAGLQKHQLYQPLSQATKEDAAISHALQLWQCTLDFQSLSIQQWMAQPSGDSEVELVCEKFNELWQKVVFHEWFELDHSWIFHSWIFVHESNHRC